MSDLSEISVPESESKPKPHSSPGRTVAEWVTLVLSIAIVGSLALFLGWDATQTRSNIVGVQTKIELENVAQKGNRWVLPIEISNFERQNLGEVHLDVTWREDGQEQEREITFNYLSEGSKQRVYLWFNNDPRRLNVKAEPTFYLID